MESIIDLYLNFGNSEYLGESVSKTTHMIQAAFSAQQNNEPDFLVLACLLHDIGHFLDEDNMNGLGVIEHGKVGAEFLRKLGMDEKVCILVESHVIAKRYLVSKNVDYYQKLSSPSKKTLEYQGGIMTEEEISIFEKNPDIDNILKVRLYDDIGKKIGADIPNLDSFYNLIIKYLPKLKIPNLNILQKHIADNGYLLVKNFFNEKDKNKIIKFREELEKLPEEKGKWMIYYEDDNLNIKSRIENFVNYNKNIKAFLYSKIIPFLNQICQNDMILFKDKINWKLANGNGFGAHQDHPAWDDFNVSRFYSVALFCNNSTKDNGCLEVAKGLNNIGIIQKVGCIPDEIVKNYQWDILETTPNDILIFDSFIPHKSGKNNTSKSRSIMYFTFNKIEEGNLYDEYFKKKRQFFPPPNERENKNILINNNKYNLANPLK